MSRLTVDLSWEALSENSPSLRKFLQENLQYTLMRKSLTDAFPQIAQEYIPQIGTRGSITTCVDGTTYRLRFGVHKSIIGVDPASNQELKDARGAYYSVLLRAIEAGVGFLKPDASFNVIYQNVKFEKLVLGQTQYTVLMDGSQGSHIVVEPTKLLRSFVFCRLQERKLELSTQAHRELALLELKRHSFSCNYKVNTPSQQSITIVPIETQVPCLIKTHSKYKQWYTLLQEAQPQGGIIEKKLTKQGLTSAQYIPYFSVAVV